MPLIMWESPRGNALHADFLGKWEFGDDSELREVGWSGILERRDTPSLGNLAGGKM